MKATSPNEAVIFFAGDSGDGIQLTGGQFSETVEIFGNDISTFPDFPAEIRAPKGTLFGVSGFQLKLGSVKVFTPGDQYDVLIAMNAAALKTNLHQLKKGGVIIANTAGFDKKNLTLAKYEVGINPLEDHSLDDYDVHDFDVTKMTQEALADSGMERKEIERCKNMFVLGFVYWMFNQDLKYTIKFLTEKFNNKPDLAVANIKVLKAGFNFADTSETFTSRFSIKPAKLPKGDYRNVNGNQAVALALVAAAKKSGLDLFYGSYPITPASNILHQLSRYKNFGVKTYQAEDEIAAICSAIGASFAGQLGTTASSGPGIALKGEAMGLAMILEIPLVIVNVQRGGPSTGLPTKTEQADLLQALYGRNGEAPIPVLAAATPKDCFEMAFMACKIAIEHMTPVLLLTDGYIANGSEPWKYPQSKDLPKIKPQLVKDKPADEKFLPYERDKNLVRKWAIPGVAGFEHRIGGLEKEINTGNVSYDPDNHEQMIKIRADKVDKVADVFPKQEYAQGSEKSKLLVIGWGSTFGAIESAIINLKTERFDIAHVHIKLIHPLPANLGEILRHFEKIIVPEMNNGQLVKVLRSKFLLPIKSVTKIKGVPFTVLEIKEAILNELSHG
ncbi:MAG: 2-oxoacid:acceptor oxidoreductase subunit alpha [Reichenbachiella sp.]|uniref:2-oxoacid:acceptor oxidoreductase subunit alpha n=1 Tax=Reichenbachiella sp. TaxID=2184521 RepID=UPI003265CE93